MSIKIVKQSSEASAAVSPGGSIDQGRNEVDSDEFSVSDEFWGTTRLKTVRGEAYARDIRPEALLATILATMAAHLDPRVVIDDTGKGYGPLNLFLTLVGPSGAGKSTTIRMAEMMLGRDSSGILFHPSTGEGAHAHFKAQITVPAKDTELGGRSRKATREERWRVRNALAIIDEIETLFNKATTQSKTLMSTLRTMWAGSAVGTSTKSQEGRLALEPMGYRISLIAGAQLSHASGLTGHVERGDGTFQRFMLIPVWMEEHDYHDGVEPVPAGEWASPGRRLWPSIPALAALDDGPLADDASEIDNEELVIITIPEHIKAELVTARRRGQSRSATGDIGHDSYHRLRWAAALAVFEERLHISQEDWERAGELMRLREAVVDEIEAVAQRARRDEDEHRGVRLRHEDAIRSGVISVEEACEEGILRVLHQHADDPHEHPDRGCNKRCMRVLSRPQQEVQDDAIAALVERGALIARGEVGARGVRYELSSSENAD